jgi:hypothetical protein
MISPTDTYFALTLSRGALVALLIFAPIALSVALWAATKHSHRFMIGSLLALTLIPIVGVSEHETIHPGVLGLVVIAYVGLIGLLPRRRATITLVDFAALIVLAGCIVSVVYGHQTKTDLEIVLLLWFCPYFAGRSITGSGLRTTVLKAFAIAGAVAIPFGLIEETYGNIFLKVFPFGSQPSAGLGVPKQRLGLFRAQGALGQPIPYAMFLSIAAVAAITLWMTRENRRENRWLYIGLAIVAVQATTLTRTGWLMLAIVAGLVVVLHPKLIFNGTNKRLVAFAAAALVVLFAVPATNKLILGTSGQESAILEESAHYRSRLIHQALQPGYIDPYGTTETQIGPLGGKSIDDEYVSAAWTWGYLPLVGFALMFLAFMRGVWRQHGDPIALAVYGTCIATMVALESVAFLTQQEVLIWLLWGCASGLMVHPVRGRLESTSSSLSSQAKRPSLAAGSEGTRPPALVR